jgi:hypothetical protein
MKTKKKNTIKKIMLDHDIQMKDIVIRIAENDNEENINIMFPSCTVSKIINSKCNVKQDTLRRFHKAICQLSGVKLSYDIYFE